MRHPKGPPRKLLLLEAITFGTFESTARGVPQPGVPRRAASAGTCAFAGVCPGEA